jgi:thymidylate synthase (FAD)
MSKVQLVTKTTGVGKYEELNSEEIISAIARHGIIKEDNGKLVKYLMDNKHWSPLDMINFTFEIETSRDIGRQILRHASIKFQEHSTRYSDRVTFEKVELRKEHPTNRQSSEEVMKFNGELDIVKLSDAAYGQGAYFQPNTAVEIVLNQIKECYEGLIALGVAKECARKILPGCLTTTISANGTLRSWLSFLNVRLDFHTEKECQEIAEQIGLALEKELPNVFGNINWKAGMFL